MKDEVLARMKVALLQLNELLDYAIYLIVLP